MDEWGSGILLRKIALFSQTKPRPDKKNLRKSRNFGHFHRLVQLEIIDGIKLIFTDTLNPDSDSDLHLDLDLFSKVYCCGRTNLQI